MDLERRVNFPGWLALMLVILVPIGTKAQIYRPDNLHWMDLKTPHFSILFHPGQDSAARAAGRILESQYRATADFTGGSLHNFPVILNDYSDNSNGFVTSDVYRMEVVEAPSAGKLLNPRNGGWFENVFPHEMTHALHLSVLPFPGVSGLIRLFAPDYARSMLYNAPYGFHEGLAVYRESNVRPGIGGRGNYAFFTNRFYSNLNENHPWSMGQLLQAPGATRPFNRYYLGGYEYVNWLQKTYGLSTARDVIDFDSRWPFLGLGTALWYVTGSSPGVLYHKFESDKKKQLASHIDSVKSRGNAPFTVLGMPFQGPSIRRPEWLTDSTLVFYGSFYNTRPGFWKMNIRTNKMVRILVTAVADGYHYDLLPKKRELVYANFRSSAVYTDDEKSDVYLVNLVTGKSMRLTNRRRVNSPFFVNGNIDALQTDHDATRLVRINRDGSLTNVYDARPDQIVLVAPDPVQTGNLAVLANRNGVQGIWLTDQSHLDAVKDRAPDIRFRNASVFDPAWSPDGKKLLFVTDYGGAMNLYEYDTEQQTVRQVTNCYFNAFEGSYAPDGRTVAFIVQKGDFRKLALIHRTNFLNRVLPDSIWHASVQRQLDRPRLGSRLEEDSKTWPEYTYSSDVNWLKPRTLAPYLVHTDYTGWRWGVTTTSSDLLLRNSYNLTFSTSNHRLWYDGYYLYTGFYPGFGLSVYDRPTGDLITPLGGSGFGTEEQGLSLYVPIHVTTERNVRFSSLSIVPELKFHRFRFVNLSGSPLNNWQSYTSADIYTSYAWRLQQDFRDAQPNSGIIIYAEAEHDIATDLTGMRKGLRTGLVAFIAPLLHYNQSLRIGIQAQTQNRSRGGLSVFNTSDLVSSGFRHNPLSGLTNVVSLSTRYTIPVWTPDNGGLLIPLYLQQVYINLFSNTAANLDSPRFLQTSQSVFGAGIHFVTGLSNLRIDIGLELGYDAHDRQFRFFANTR